MRRLWRFTGFIGRDLFVAECRDKIKAGQSFCIHGADLSGKTAALEYLHDKEVKPRAISNCAKAYTEVLKDLVRQLDFKPAKENIPDMEKAIYENTGAVLFLDCVDKMTGRKEEFLKKAVQLHTVVGASKAKKISPYLEEVRLPALKRRHACELAEKINILLDKNMNPKDIVDASALPGKILLMVRASKVEKTDNMGKNILSIGPLLVILLSGLIFFRFLGRAVDATDLMILGGAATIFLIIGRRLLG